MQRHLLNAFKNNGLLLFKCHKSNKSGVDPAILKTLDNGFAKLSKSKSTSLLKKHLTSNIFKALREKRTKTSTLLDCIQSGFANHDSGCGIYAPDAEAYKVFADIFDPIIQDYHFGFKKSDCHPPKELGNPCIFGDLDPFKHYIASTRIRCARSVKGFPFNPCMTKQQYDDLEDLVHCALDSLRNDLKGRYYPLYGMKKSIKKKLIDDHFLFKEGDRFLQAANASRFWPTGRGIFHNFDRTFLVWCNEEDHIRIISMERGGNFANVYSRLVTGINALEEQIPFERDDRLGYLTFCPTNLGTTIRASAHIRLPKLASNRKMLESIAAKYKLQVRGTRGEHSESEGGIYDVSNKRRLGLTEFQAVKEIYCGLSKIIKLEKAEKGKTSDKKGGKKQRNPRKAYKKPETNRPQSANSKTGKKAGSKAGNKADSKAGKIKTPKPLKKLDVNRECKILAKMKKDNSKKAANKPGTKADKKKPNTKNKKPGSKGSKK